MHGSFRLDRLVRASDPARVVGRTGCTLGAMVRSYYDVLGVEFTATREEIRRAYRQRVRELHPDRHGGLPAHAAAELTRQLVEVTDAWRVLGDEDRRILYDQVWQAAARRARLVAGGGVGATLAGQPQWDAAAGSGFPGARPAGAAAGQPMAGAASAGQPHAGAAAGQPVAGAASAGQPHAGAAAGQPVAGTAAPARGAPAAPGTGPPPVDYPPPPRGPAGTPFAPRAGVPAPPVARPGAAPWVPRTSEPGAAPWVPRTSDPGPERPSAGTGTVADPPHRRAQRHRARPGAGGPAAPSAPSVPGRADEAGLSAARSPGSAAGPVAPPGTWPATPPARPFTWSAGLADTGSAGLAGHPGAVGRRGAATRRGAADRRDVADDAGAADRRGAGGRPSRDRQAGECRLCGGAPAVPVDLRGQRAGLLSGLLSGGGPVERGPLCRLCGLAVLRELTDTALCGGRPSGSYGTRAPRRSLLADVLALGWLLNALTVIGNLAFWPRLRRLRPPERDPWVRSPLLGPLDPGPPLFARRGAAVLMTVVAVALAAAAAVLLAGLVAHGAAGP